MLHRDRQPPPQRTTRALSLVALGLLYGTGCNPPPERMHQQPPGPRDVWRLETAGRSVQGRPIDCWVLGQGRDVTLIIATIHGDETAGTPLVRRLAARLAEEPSLADGRKVVIVPVANPDGMALGSRFNARGVDLNRNYPAENYEHDGDHGERALSEPESAALHRLLQQHRPNRIVSFHQPIRKGAPCIDYDGPGRELADAMAARCDLPVRKLGGRPGSLGSYAGETMGKPIITVELPTEATRWDEQTIWNRYGGMLLAAVRYPEGPSAK